jgi:hypothetical protein
MAEMQKRDPSTGKIILLLVGVVVVGAVCSQIKGSRDGCEAQGRRPYGLECVEPKPSP